MLKYMVAVIVARTPVTGRFLELRVVTPFTLRRKFYGESYPLLRAYPKRAHV